MTRTETIETLLQHLPDYEQPPGRTGTGTGDHTPTMPSMWNHPSVRELYRTLQKLRHYDRAAWWHLEAHYRSETRTITTTILRRRKGRLTKETGPRTTQRITSPHISQAHVQRGRLYIIANYRGEPYLPNELLEPIHISQPDQVPA